MWCRRGCRAWACDLGVASRNRTVGGRGLLAGWCAAGYPSPGPRAHCHIPVGRLRVRARAAHGGEERGWIVSTERGQTHWHPSDYLWLMTYRELIELAFRCEGRELSTVTGKRFTVGVHFDCPFFTPKATGRGRSDGRNAAERFLARYNETGSNRPSDYADVTRNSSYNVGLILVRTAGRS